MKDLSGKIAVVSGAYKGIGRAIAQKFLDENIAVLAVLDIRVIDCADFIGSEGRMASFCCDISDSDQVRQVFDEIYVQFGRIDILVNNAGVIADAMFHKMTDAQWNTVMKINILGMYNCTKQVIQRMREQNYGKIVNISSTSAFGAVGQCNYSLSKAGIIGFTKSLAKESARKNITVNAVAPDFINTDMMNTVSREALEIAKKEAPMQRMGEPEEVASLVAFLSSDESSYVSGECIRCGGAYHT